MYFLLLVTQSIIICGVCIAALLVGDRPAKLVGAGCLAAWVATTFAHKPHETGSVQYGVAFIDLALLVYVAVIAIRYRHNWTIAAGGFLMLTVATHIAYMIDLHIVSNVRITASIIWGYMTIVCLAWGTWSGWQRQRRGRVRLLEQPPP
jgi:hypothetical protein